MHIVKYYKNRFLSHWDNIHSRLSNMESEDARRRRVFLILAVPGGLILLIYGIYNLLYDNLIGGILDIAFSIVLAASGISLTFVKSPNFIFRSNLFALMLIIVLWGLDGGIHGEKLLWAFCFPPMALILFNRKEGLIWSLLLFTIIQFIFLADGPLGIDVYNQQFKFRFISVFLLLITVTALYEALLYAYQTTLISKQSRLDEETEKLAIATETMKSTNEALLKSESLLQNAQSIAHIGNWEYDYLSKKVWCSYEIFRIFGTEYSDHYLTLHKVVHIIPDLKILKNQAEKTLSSSRNFEFEFPARRVSDRSKIHIFLKAQQILNKNGKPVKLTGIIQDITDRYKVEKEKRELQIELAQAQKIETIGTLAGGITHDFNNILSPIIGMTEILLEDMTPGSTEYENTRQILIAGQRGSNLVKRIQAFSRQAEDRLIPVRIQDILEETINLCRPTIPADIEITNNIQSECGLVMADPVHLHQIVMNLITNAYHAVEETSGRITVTLKETNNRDGDLPEPGQYAVLSVSDTGCGIDPAVMDRIFEPYFTTKDKSKGTGLGLSVASGIITKLNGEIRVSSETGKGTTFDVYLPLTEEIPEPAPEVQEEVPKTGEGSILMVDDEEVITQIGKQMLERAGYSVITYTNSPAALDTFKKDPAAFDLVISDMTMPKMTGDQFARQIMSVRSDIPIIICTGFSERIDKERAMSMGIKGFLPKPFSAHDLLRTVRDALNKPEGTA